MRKDIDHIEMLHLEPGFIRTTIVHVDGSRVEMPTVTTTMEQAADLAASLVGPVSPANVVHVVRRRGTPTTLTNGEVAQWHEIHMRQFAESVRQFPEIREHGNASALAALDRYQAVKA